MWIAYPLRQGVDHTVQQPEDPKMCSSRCMQHITGDAMARVTDD
jgi:hypothetical protein